ncbi:MAG: V-type H+-transporting ATPase subunit I [Candidatus Saganbacteria bacterium]|uniref:V-type H+-transporting ATPase subunit I n=1 Tax=Candidatus Saganbacteria bacterium TaxID=2575572 RepID=A0A833L2F3_UNCSA|nr:MAG: V-type H+-transporting ATPase subunit I [Candidatus Saganbacteria bacterium]
MAVAEVVKTLIIGHKSLQNSVIEKLSKEEIIQIISQGAKPQTSELELSEIKAAITFLEKAANKKKNLLESFAPTREIVDEETLNMSYKKFNWGEIIKSVKDIEQEIGNLRSFMVKLKSEIEILSPWQNLTTPLNILAGAKTAGIISGSIKTKKLEEFKNNLSKLTPFAEISVVNSEKTDTYLLVVFLKREEKAINGLLAKNEFVKIPLPSSKNTAKEELEQHQQLQETSRENLFNLEKKAKEMAKVLPRLGYVYDFLFIKKSEEDAQASAFKTKSAFFIEGWIKNSNFNKLKKILSNISNTIDVQKISPKEGEIAPVIIENPKIFRPFELITKIFGLPKQNEIDPSTALSFFYLLFFAVCLSDAGYGLILAAASYYLLKKLQLSEGGKNLMLLLIWGGVLTIPIGIITGSYFSISLEAIPHGGIRNLLIGLRIIDPIKNPINVLLISLLLGVFQNICGLVIAMCWQFKNKQYLEGILNHGLWIFFLMSLVIMSGTMFTGSIWAGTFSKLSIIGALLLVLTQGRQEPTFIKKTISGILSLYKTTSYLGDTLSYSRLLALMMTTSIIGMVVNIIAGITAGIPFVGYVIMVIILVGGHLFNLVISVLGAFIHSMRLQLVEFFGKFYEGGGREFKPFKKETKYVLIK